MTEGKLVKKIFVSGKIEVLTGLHIGGSDIGLSVGGTDAIVARDPITGKPYIPGSSLKGKMRSLLEKVLGRFDDQARMGNVKVGPCSCGTCQVCRLFGFTGKGPDGEHRTHASRLIVRDGQLENEHAFAGIRTDMPFAEIKTEVVIDRITSAATPRQIERVPAGAEFELQLVLNIFEEDIAEDKDEEKKMLDDIFASLMLVQDDYIGGSGTRGYGQVRITVEQLTYKDGEIYKTAAEPKRYEFPVPEELTVSAETAKA